ncbi:23S rRNA pseudouridine(2605) synthase [Forsythia ovata]|uniref:23S rRNA pseudouridine(2605) synthase n=1 Tax=Forsythia ovata TaxID=205694 RepID=A0ABD1WGQ9_9LAMI
MRDYRLIYLIHFIFVFLKCSFLVDAILDLIDFLALQPIQKSLDDLPGSNYFDSWDFTLDPCNFAGVYCDGDKVIALNLSDPRVGSSGLTGRIDPAIGKLFALVELTIVLGRIIWSMPQTLSQLKNLRFLAFSRNFIISSDIPATLGELKGLQTLDLSFNQFSAKQPASSAEPKFSKAARRFYNENFGEQPQRLAKVLAAAGVASRRSSEELIFQGKVTVNGSVCNTPQTRVDPAQDVIYVNGNRLAKKLPPKVYLALNKPKGYICSAGEKETKSVISLFDDYMNSWNKRNPGLPKPRLFTVGRLDVGTTGLIIVTNDGEFAQKLSHPSSNLSKEYIATIDGAVNKRHLIAISEGTVVEGVHCTPEVVELLPQQPDISRPRLRIVVHEGRNHEVRELVKNAGLQIHALKRVRISGFRLPSDLGLGKHVELNPSNLRALGYKS